MAVYSKRNKALFIHIPKTAGTAIQWWMQKRKSIKKSRKHTTMFDHADLLEDKDLFCFTCIRHPYTLVVSAYFYINKWDEFLKDPFTLEDWILNDRMLDKEWNSICARLQHEYLDFDRIDYIMRFENLEEDFKKIQEHFSSKAPLNNHESEISRTDTVSLTDEMKEKIYSHYQKDFEIFNFERY